MAPRRRLGTLVRMLSAAAAAAAAVLVAVALLAPAPRPPQQSVAAAQPAQPAGASSGALLPSYVVRIPPPAPAGAAEPRPAPVTLSVQPVVTPAAAEPATEKWYVTARALNVRSEPSSQSGLVAALPRGTAVAVSNTQGNWLQVSAGDVTGWAFAKYLSRTPP